MSTHETFTYRKHYEQILSKTITFEIVEDNNKYKVGDLIVVNEIRLVNGIYELKTDRQVVVRVIYVADKEDISHAIKQGYGLIGFELCH